MNSDANLKFRSIALTKAIDLGLNVPSDLERLAVLRGCRYYDVRNESSELAERQNLAVSKSDYSNADLAVALISPELETSLLRQRMASALLSSLEVDADKIALLAQREDCADLVRWIAMCGQEVEPELSFWEELIKRLPESEVPEHAAHPTRFVEMTGLSRGKIGIQKRWIRAVGDAA